jgi:hypothetical protein
MYIRSEIAALRIRDRGDPPVRDPHAVLYLEPSGYM